MGRKQRQRRWWGVERRLAASCEIWLLNKRPHPENSPNGMAWLAWTPCKQKGARNAHSWLKREQAEHADARYKMAALYVDVECRGEAYTERCPKVAGDLDTLFFKSRAGCRAEPSSAPGCSRPAVECVQTICEVSIFASPSEFGRWSGARTLGR